MSNKFIRSSEAAGKSIQFTQLKKLLNLQWLIVVIVAMILKPGWGAQTCSTHYCIQKSTINAGGKVMISSQYRLSASMAQESIIGVSTSSQFIIQSGFWAGTRPAVVLMPYYNEKPVVDDNQSPMHNGMIEPNEYVNLVGTLENTGMTTALNVIGRLTTTAPITISKPNATYPNIPAGDNKSCDTCYEIMAPPANCSSTHWDFSVTEKVASTYFGPAYYDYAYHVGLSFSDVSYTNLFYKYIEKLLHSEVTAGCTATNYCPANIVARQQMAKFICASMEKKAPGSCSATSCTGLFADVPAANSFCAYIEALYNGGVVSGCQILPLQFCPSGFTQRQAMAKFICLGLQNVNPGSCLIAPCAGLFNDVPSSNPFCSFIEAIYDAGITAGCQTNPQLFCPSANVSREQMAKFIVNGFGFNL